MKISNQVVSASQNTQGHAQDKGDREQGISWMADFQHRICEIFIRKLLVNTQENREDKEQGVSEICSKPMPTFAKCLVWKYTHGQTQFRDK